MTAFGNPARSNYWKNLLKHQRFRDLSTRIRPRPKSETNTICRMRTYPVYNLSIVFSCSRTPIDKNYYFILLINDNLKWFALHIYWSFIVSVHSILSVTYNRFLVMIFRKFYLCKYSTTTDWSTRFTLSFSDQTFWLTLQGGTLLTVVGKWKLNTVLFLHLKNVILTVTVHWNEHVLA